MSTTLRQFATFEEAGDWLVLSEADRYALKLAVIPTVVLLGIGIGHMMSSAVFAEIVFARPGVGKLIYDSVATRNYPVVLGAVAISTGFYVLCTMTADLVAAYLDPRVRASL
jgi:peptide/nickel transport system permease protein